MIIIKIMITDAMINQERRLHLRQLLFKVYIYNEWVFAETDSLTGLTHW